MEKDVNGRSIDIFRISFNWHSAANVCRGTAVNLKLQTTVFINGPHFHAWKLLMKLDVSLERFFYEPT
jgi:hypothetical protein